MFYSARHYRMLADVSTCDDGRAPERLARRQAGERAYADTLAHFGAITPENARQALEWQAARLTELLEAR